MDAGKYRENSEGIFESDIPSLFFIGKSRKFPVVLQGQ